MGLEQVTSTGRVTTKERRLLWLRTPAGIYLEDLPQSHGQALQAGQASRHPVRSSSLSPTCMESSPQISPSKMRTVEMLFGIRTVMGQYLEVGLTFAFHQTATRTQIRIQISRIHTMTRQGKGTAFSRVAQATNISKSRRLKCSELMLKQQQKITNN